MYTVTTDKLVYSIPSHISCIKSLRVSKVAQDADIAMLDPGRFDNDYYSIDYGWVKNYPKLVSETDKQLLLKMSEGEHMPTMSGYYQFWSILHLETLKNSYKGGDKLDGFRFRDINN